MASIDSRYIGTLEPLATLATKKPILVASYCLHISGVLALLATIPYNFTSIFLEKKYKKDKGKKSWFRGQLGFIADYQELIAGHGPWQLATAGHHWPPKH